MYAQSTRVVLVWWKDFVSCLHATTAKLVDGTDIAESSRFGAAIILQ